MKRLTSLIAIHILLMITPAISQTLWGIDVSSLTQAQKWKSTTDQDGNPLKIRYNCGDFDFVSSNDFGYLFFRKYPPDYMYDEVLAKLIVNFGEPTLEDHYTPRTPDLDYYTTPLKVQLGKWKFYSQWTTDTHLIDLSWKEDKLIVQCIIK